MKINRAGRFGFLQIRALVALLLFGAAICLAKFSIAPSRAINGARERGDVDRPRYMPVQGERGEELNRMEEEWNNRLTYPTGIFNPAWVRQAAAQDAQIARSIPLGLPANNLNQNDVGLTLDPNNFTSLGPRPLRM